MDVGENERFSTRIFLHWLTIHNKELGDKRERGNKIAPLGTSANRMQLYS